jgi:uncharacterized membrane protein YgdD (TMEM256/DUF423 family)
MNAETEPVQRPLVALGAALAGLSVVLGAFGSHALRGRIAPAALGWWQTAVQYLMWHALAVLVLGLVGARWVRLPALLLAGGALIFSGTLYVLALGAPRWVGAITPLGGVAMIAGWALLAWRGSRRYSD